jgi:hypothetical protein
VPEKTIAITALLDEEIAAWLERYCERHKLGKSTAVRMLLVEAMRQESAAD